MYFYMLWIHQIKIDVQVILAIYQEDWKSRGKGDIANIIQSEIKNKSVKNALTQN